MKILFFAKEQITKHNHIYIHAQNILSTFYQWIAGCVYLLNLVSSLEFGIVHEFQKMFLVEWITLIGKNNQIQKNNSYRVAVFYNRHC